MAFAQITYRESLRDIEACLSAQSAKPCHVGLPGPIRRSTLADANEARDWRIYAEFAQRLIAQARRLYAGDDPDVVLPGTVHALDSTTIDLCLSVFPWAHFRSTKTAVKMHTLLDLRGSQPRPLLQLRFVRIENRSIGTACAAAPFRRECRIGRDVSRASAPTHLNRCALHAD